MYGGAAGPSVRVRETPSNFPNTTSACSSSRASSSNDVSSDCRQSLYLGILVSRFLRHIDALFCMVWSLITGVESRLRTTHEKTRPGIPGAGHSHSSCESMDSHPICCPRQGAYVPARRFGARLLRDPPRPSAVKRLLTQRSRRSRRREPDAGVAGGSLFLSPPPCPPPCAEQVGAAGRVRAAQAALAGEGELYRGKYIPSPPYPLYLETVAARRAFEGKSRW